MDPTGNTKEINLTILYEDPDSDEGKREVQEALERVEKSLDMSIESYPVSRVESVKPKSMVYLLAVLKNPQTVKALEEIPRHGAQLLGKLPLEHIAGKAADRARTSGCRELILFYRKTPGVYREEQDDAWRLAMLIENLSGIPVTPSDTPELGGDCIIVATLTRGRLTSEASVAASMYGKKILVASILDLVKDDLPQLVKRALRASGIIV
ncbi:MAG: hypothetical protein F7B18_04455 [Desulfurococcales archaeon]|nr:hypothetical protein [Desulfurococcales archaeon]